MTALNTEQVTEILDHPFSFHVKSWNGIHRYSVDLDYYPTGTKPFPARCTCKDMARCWKNQADHPHPVQHYLIPNGSEPGMWKVNPLRHYCKHVFEAMMYRIYAVMVYQADKNLNEEGI